MISDNGHLVFKTGNNKEIRFQTSESGQIKVDNEDLIQLLSQVSFHFPSLTCPLDMIKYDSPVLLKINQS